MVLMLVCLAIGIVLIAAAITTAGYLGIAIKGLFDSSKENKSTAINNLKGIAGLALLIFGLYMLIFGL